MACLCGKYPGRCAMLAAVLLAVACGRPPASDVPPAVRANDNRTPGGVLRRDTLTLRLVAQLARWHPEADSGPAVHVQALGEEGKAPQIPAPLVRVPVGTVIDAYVRNALTDSTLWIRGLAAPGAARDSVAIPPGRTHRFTFTAGAPGTFLYRATPGTAAAVEREQMAGAIVVDSSGARPDDRVLVINIWGDPIDSTGYRNALTINGRSWPHTERFRATVGDSIRWRVVNGSQRPHPMHLHGFYFRIDARGDGRSDTSYTAPQRRLAVTEVLHPGQTMSMVWSPDRDGNWLFHCHLGFHVIPDTRLNPPHDHADALSQDAGTHMAGLVLGVEVRAPRGWREPTRGAAERFRLFVQEGKRVGRAPRALGYVLGVDGRDPPPDSISFPGPVLVMHRGQPTDVTVMNRLREPTAVHWHGVELESYSDGVAGWSGAGRRIAPMIAPADSFTARLTLPRAGTFIYHTHLGDLEQLTSGLYGALVVLEPGRRFDPATDHVFVAGWDGAADPRLVVNGDSTSGPVDYASGVPHRLRFINIGMAEAIVARLTRDTSLVSWRPVAKDGADLPPPQARVRPSMLSLDVGETHDVEFTPPAAGSYTLTVSLGPFVWRQPIRVR
jgi:FtsP/CotA-like multicopper oxidase with cupredoxin domain